MPSSAGDPPSDVQAELKSIPGVDSVLEQVSSSTDVPRPLRTFVIRRELDRVRRSVLDGNDCPGESTIISNVDDRLDELRQNRIQPVINATGVVLHTNLGRAPYGDSQLEAIQHNTSGYCSLEMDLGSGERGGRGSYAIDLLTQLTGADDGLIANNCSAALVLCLKALSDDREVIISRGELVQIGGGFRIPDILEVSGAELAEVGTTNQTSLDDYADAITESTGMILSVHRSNFDMDGFVDCPGHDELVELADRHDLPMVADLGSGAVVNTEEFGIAHEPRPQEILEQGVDLVLFSGDKLLGGPQAGIVLGTKEYIESMQNHPLFRALRCGKATLTGLEAVLTSYANDETEDIPAQRMLSLEVDELEKRAQTLADDIDHPDVSVTETEDTVGGGALPQATLEGRGLLIDTDSPEQLGDHLRNQSPPIIALIRDQQVVVSIRTVMPSDSDRLTDSITTALEEAS